MSDDGPEIWIGIADAVPIDREKAEVGLDEAEPVRNRLRSGEDVAQDLLELALDAALQREARLGVFHTYPPEDAPDPDAYEARARGGPIRAANRDGKPDARGRRDPLQLARGDRLRRRCRAEWALFQLVDGNGLADGFCAVKLERISEIAPVDPEESPLPRLLAARPLAPHRPRADLTAARPLLADAQRLPGLVSITTEDLPPGAFRIGGISALSDDGVLLRTVSRLGAWSDEEYYAYDAITEIGFGGRYAEALALAAGAPD